MTAAPSFLASIEATWRLVGRRDMAAAGAAARALLGGVDFVSWEDRLALARLLHAVGAFDEATDVYVGLAQGHVLLIEDVIRAADCANRIGDPWLAAKYFQQLGIYDPAHLVALIGRGIEASRVGRLAEAMAWYRRALAVRPHHPQALNNLAILLRTEGRHAEAARTLREAVEASPDRAGPLKNLAGMLYYMPGAPMAAFDEVHRRWYEACRAPAPLPARPRSLDPERRIRVAIVSSDFRDHPVGRNFLPVFEGLDRDRFEILLFDQHSSADRIHARYAAGAALVQPIASFDDALAAQVIADAAPDIAIFTAGHFDENRPMLASWRVAPVQISYLDCGRLHLPEMDYLLVGRAFAPRGLKEPGSERILHLPRFYQHAPLAEVDLPPLPDAFTFGAFNNPAKLSRPVLDAWAEILRRAPAARLRLRYRGDYAHPALAEKIRRRFDFAGNRVSVEAGMLPSSEHLASIGACDVHLDTFPFPGSTTAFTCAWMGVPTLTMGGDTIMSNYGAGMNRQFGLEGFTAGSVEAYVARAVELANDRASLAPIRARLRERVRNTACRSNAREFGRWLSVLWRRHCLTETRERTAA